MTDPGDRDDVIRDKDIAWVYFRDISDHRKRIRHRGGRGGVAYGKAFRKRSGFSHFSVFDGGTSA